jgi:Family of unknown function (DUF6174)
MKKVFIFFNILFIILPLACNEQLNAPSPDTPYELWHSYNLHNYTIEQIRSCFCVNGGESMKVTFLDDTVFSVIKISDSTEIPYPYSKQYLTIDSLFGIINNSNDSLIITYDAHYGYPNKLDINPQLHPVDGGVMFETSNLQIIK